nr:hypothetical protein [Ancylomarina sp. DW003]
MEQSNDFTFEYTITMDRLYNFFSDLMDEEFEESEKANCFD